MTLKEDIRSVSNHLDTPELLRHLIKERFPGKTIVTASLRAPSIVVLKMISEIDPATPIVICQRPPVFEESAEFRAIIVEKLGLTNISTNVGHETGIKPGDHDHCERMWVHYRDMPGRSFEILHLNECLGPYSCWISSVYHVREPSPVSLDRVDVDGRLIRVNPLLRWTKDDVREYMRAHSLPYHKMAARKFNYDESKEGAAYPTYHF